MVKMRTEHIIAFRANVLHFYNVERGGNMSNFYVEDLERFRTT